MPCSLDAATLVDWSRKFRSEYDAARSVLADAAAFAPAGGRSSPDWHR
jgi:hypothetical protein